MECAVGPLYGKTMRWIGTSPSRLENRLDTEHSGGKAILVLPDAGGPVGPKDGPPRS